MSTQHTPMEEVGGTTSQEVLTSLGAANGEHQMYDGRRRSSILQKLGLFIRECIEVSPNLIPVSPRTRQAANTEHSSPRRTVRLRVASLPAVLHREPVGVEALEGQSGKLRLSLIVDSVVPTVMRYADSRGRTQDEPIIAISEGMGQFITLEIALKGKSRQVSVILESSRDRQSPRQVSAITINPSANGNDFPEAKVISQTVKWDDREFEYLDIFDQPGQESKLGADNTDCVICLTTRRNTVMLPCRHMCACIECAETLSTTNGTCPICRQAFSNMITITEESLANSLYKDQKC